MWIKRLVLENVRGFRNLDFRFERKDGGFAGWTVVTGDNASGKTTLLKAIALALVGPDAARSLQPSFKGWIRSGETEAIVAVEVVVGENDRFAQGRRYDQPFWSELHIVQNGGPEPSLVIGSKYKRKGKGPTHGPWAENPAGWFSCGYGPFRRLYGSSSEAQRIMSEPGRVARFATMFREDATLGECEIWLKDLNHKKLEGRPTESLVLEQVLKLLNRDFLRNGLQVERIDSEGLWLKDPNNVLLPLSEMSDGYRASLAMLTDILRHMVDVYRPVGLIQQSNSDFVVPHEGVVLIDEMDSHLHPEWQRKIGFWLKERFPRVQFIVTSHSPFVCQAADECSIYHLPPPGRGEDPFQIKPAEYWKIVRSKVDAIYLSPAFAMEFTRSPRAVEARRRHAELRAKAATGPLSQPEKQLLNQTRMFVDPDEEAE